MGKETLLGEHRFEFDKKSHSGDGPISLVTKIYHNGDPYPKYEPKKSIFVNQSIVMHTCMNQLEIKGGCLGLMPKQLRQLADELERELEKAEAKVKEMGTNSSLS